MGVAQQLMDTEDVVPHNLACLCSATTGETGPAKWHRDIGPGEPAPLRGMISNMQHHGPSYLQWNIALYDDSVFWIVPRSHRRVNTDEENRQLAENASVPLPGGMPVELNARRRSRIHPPIAALGQLLQQQNAADTASRATDLYVFPLSPNVHWRHWEPGFYHYLSDSVRAQFEAWDALFFAEFDLVARIFHAIINKNVHVFQMGIDPAAPIATRPYGLHRYALKIEPGVVSTQTHGYPT